MCSASKVFIQYAFNRYTSKSFHVLARYRARQWECKDQWGTYPALKVFTVQKEIQALNTKICNSSLIMRNDKKEIKIRFVGESAYSWDMKTWILICRSWEKGSTLGGYMTMFKSPVMKKLESGGGSVSGHRDDERINWKEIWGFIVHSLTVITGSKKNRSIR